MGSQPEHRFALSGSRPESQEATKAICVGRCQEEGLREKLQRSEASLRGPEDQHPDGFKREGGK